MGIPGLKPEHPVRAKVRIGVKGRSNGREFPKSVDYFVSDDADFARVCGEQPKTIRILLPFEGAGDNFSTGMEYWRKNQLACYTKDSGDRPVALRVPTLVQPTDELRGDPIKSGRQPITCTFRECEFFKSKACKPMGRLQFFIEGVDPSGGVYQLDTKSWNSIERLEAFMGTLGDPRGRVFELSVAFEQRGRDRFPLLSITEAEVKVLETDSDIDREDALLQLRRVVDTNERAEVVREKLADALDHTNPGWRDNGELIARIREIGPVEAAKGLLVRNES